MRVAYQRWLQCYYKTLILLFLGMIMQSRSLVGLNIGYLTLNFYLFTEIIRNLYLYQDFQNLLNRVHHHVVSQLLFFLLFQYILIYFRKKVFYQYFHKKLPLLFRHYWLIHVHFQVVDLLYFLSMILIFYIVKEMIYLIY